MMKRMLLILALLVSMMVSFAMESDADLATMIPGEINFTRANPALYISRNSLERTTISLSNPEILVGDSLTAFGTCQIYAIPGEPMYYVDGAPSVPQITRLYRIPNTGSVDLEVYGLDYELVENVNPMPIQSQERDGVAQLLVRDNAVYSADEWFPAQPIVMSEPMIFRDFRVVRVTIYPVQVNAATGQARLYSNISADVVANSTPGTNEILRTRRPSRVFAPLYQSLIPNLDEHALDEVTVDPGTYLILCKNNNNITPLADTLAYMKKRQGYDVIIDRRASWNAAQMSTAIQQVYDESDPPLEFVCILGDPQGSNGFGMPTGGGEYDHQFTQMDGNDDIEDIAVGRISATNATEFNTAFAKFWSYQMNPYMDDPSWFRKAFMYAGVTTGFTSNRILMRWARRQFYEHTQKDTVYYDTHQGPVNNQTIANRFNSGISFFLWRGTVVGEMGSGAPSGCANGFKLPICLSITCGSGDFDNGRGLNEEWLFQGSPSTPKAGVCGIGTATFGTHVNYNNTVAGGLAYNICNLGVEHIGAALAGSKATLISAFPGDDYAINFIRWNNLMGEPATSMWTRQPTVFDVTYPSTVNVGTRRIRPQVTDHATGEPIADALVVIWKRDSGGDETFSRMLTDAGGFIDVPVTVNSPGLMTITVTKRNHVPYLGDIQCVASDQMVTATAWQMDDDNVGGSIGNSDGNLNPSETIDLSVYLKNFGTSVTGTNVSAVLTSLDPFVTIANGTQSYANIAPGDSTVANPFRVIVSPTIMAGHRILFTMEVNASGQLSHSSFVLEAQAGIPVFDSRQVSGGNGNSRLDPNETVNLNVTVRNSGVLAMSDVTAVLRSSSSFVNIVSGTSAYPVINVNGTGTNSTAFVVRAHPLTYPGHQARLSLILTSNSGHIDTVQFILPVGQIAATDPTGPDAYGYYAYESGDQDVQGVPYEVVRPYEWVEISSTGTDLDLNDTGEQNPSDPIWTRVRQLPFPFTFYGVEFDSISICSNGWAAFGDVSEQDHFRNYPLPGQQSPAYMLAPFWDDLRTSDNNHGVWVQNDETNHRYIIQWKAKNPFSGNTNEYFEIILLDPVHYPTRDGNGIVIFQYQDVSDVVGNGNDVPYCTIGIQGPGSTVGLTYRFDNLPSPGAQSNFENRAIVITTEARNAFGTVTGTVTDARTGQPMQNVTMTIDGERYNVSTDASGHYTIENVLIGTYNVRARKVGYNDGLATEIVVELDSTEVVNFSMVHPEIDLSRDEIVVDWPQQPAETQFDMINNGNGQLDYSISIEFVNNGEHIDPWDSLSTVNISQSTNDMLINGCEFVGDYWWVTGGGSSGQGKRFYRYDLNGNLVNSIPQPGQGQMGWFDLAYDGNLIYGSGDEYIYGVDMDGVVRDTINGPANPNRALAYDPRTDHFWVADYSSPLREIDRNGAILRTLNTGMNILGLSWHAGDLDGYYLYAHVIDSTHGRAPAIWRFHPITGDRHFVATTGSGIANERPGGCTITSGWNNTLVVLGAIIQSAGGADRLSVRNVAFNTSWITVTPANSQVNPSSSRPITITFVPTGLRTSDYRVNLLIENNSIDSMVVVPVTLSVTTAVDDDGNVVVPNEYVLHQNFPNPFNPSTTFGFDLKEPGLTQLRIFNLLGQEVATVLNDYLPAGAHTIRLDMSGYPSGEYIYVLESGDFRKAHKMVLLK